MNVNNDGAIAASHEMQMSTEPSTQQQQPPQHFVMNSRRLPPELENCDESTARSGDLVRRQLMQGQMPPTIQTQIPLMQGQMGHPLNVGHPSGQQRNEEHQVYAVPLQHNGPRYASGGSVDYFDSRGMPPSQQMMHQTLSPNDRSVGYFKAHPSSGGPTGGAYHHGGGVPPGVGWMEFRGDIKGGGGAIRMDPGIMMHRYRMPSYVSPSAKQRDIMIPGQMSPCDVKQRYMIYKN